MSSLLQCTQHGTISNVVVKLVIILAFELLFRFLPNLLDAGIQIWNAFEINNMTLPTVDANPKVNSTIPSTNTEKCQIVCYPNVCFCVFKYPSPIYWEYRRPLQISRSYSDSYEAVGRRKRNIDFDNTIYNININLSLNYNITLEKIVSIVLVQLPGIVLGILGIIKAFNKHGCSRKTFVDSMR